MREEPPSSTEREMDKSHVSDDATIARAVQVCRIMNESLRQRTPQERDRIMQTHLAQARGASFFVVTPEDVILMKLLWRRETRSQKQWRDALGVAKVKGACMDWTYLWEQAETLRLEDDLLRLRDEAGI